MSAVKSTTALAPGNYPPAAPRRLTMQQTAAAIGTNLGTLIQLRAKGARLYDPSFPPMVGGNFDEAAIMAWKTARDERGIA